ncbi:MAG: CorA family divalent cation transporter [Candidatus Taylorbacteria bacterium]
MTHTHTYRGVVWIDLENPTDEEVSSLVNRYGLHPLVGEELKMKSSIAKVDFYPEYFLAVLTLPVRERKNVSTQIVEREIDFVVGKNFLITSRTETIEQLEYFGKIFEANSILNKEEKIEHAGYLFYYMVKKIYAGMIEDLENIKDSIITAEKRIFGGDEKEIVEVLSSLSRELIDFKQTARMHRDIWEDMVKYSDQSMFGGEFPSYVRDIRDQFNIIHEFIGNARELITDLRETNDSLLNTRQNDIMKLLTIITLICYPAIIVSAIFTIPAQNIPVLNSPYGWVILMGIILIITGCFWWYFKKKRWM